MIAIVNPEAAGGRAGRQWLRLKPHLERRYGPIEERVTTAPHDAELFAREASLRGDARIAVLGGDGTLGEAVNGLAEPEGGALHGERPEIVYVPLGSGGDFARCTAFSRMPIERGIGEATARAVDLGRLSLRAPGGAERTRLFVNIASAGLSADIARRVNRAGKRIGGGLSFRLATVRGLLAWRDARVRLVLDGRDAGVVDASIAAIANGRYFGSGMCIAPKARLDSGAFEVAVVRGASLGLFLRHGGKLARGQHAHLPQFSRFEARTVEILPEEPERALLVEADGECPGLAPCHAEILPGAVMIVAPW